MRQCALLCLSILIVGCNSGERRTAANSTAAAARAMPAPLALADIAGRWTVSAVRQGSSISYVTYDMNVTGDTSGWTVVFPDRPAMPARVLTLAGDSFVVEIGPYRSVVRPNVKVVARTTGRLVNGRLTGRFAAHYGMSGPDSLVVGRFEATRAP